MKIAGPQGLLVLDKPLGLTSRAAVDRVQGWFPRGTRIGHTGTLDPLARGVLVLTLGAATRLGEYVQRMGKTYRTTICLGTRSATDDAEGPLEQVADAPVPDRAAVDRVLPAFLGNVAQVPPAFSAAKVAGRRAYALARRGADVTLEPRLVHIERIDILAYAYPQLELEVHCGKGTYIRSLARDLGEHLGCGGYVTALRRLRVGPFDVAGALPLDANREAAWAHLLPLATALQELPALQLPPAQARLLCQGRAVPLTVELQQAVRLAPEAGVLDGDGKLLAVPTLDLAAMLLRPAKVLEVGDAG